MIIRETKTSDIPNKFVGTTLPTSIEKSNNFEIVLAFVQRYDPTKK